MRHKKHLCTAALISVLLGVVGPAGAAVISVDSYTGNIQNYGGTPMDAGTEWWVTDPSDADVDGNGYAWDAVDNDFVAGWRANAPNEYIVVNFDPGLEDIAGDDLVIRMYGGPSASASVLGSTDGGDFTEIGTIGSGTPGYLRDEAFDFGGAFSGNIHYVKVLRQANGAQTGMFFDSFASVPEPATMVLLACGGAALLVRRRKSAWTRSANA